LITSQKIPATAIQPSVKTSVLMKGIANRYTTAWISRSQKKLVAQNAVMPSALPAWRWKIPPALSGSLHAQRLTAAVTEAFSCMPVRVLCGVRNSVAITIVSSTRRVSGWTPPQSSLADRVRERLLTLGPAVLIGVSRDQPSTAFIPRAWHEAEAALSFARVTERVVLFAELPVRRLPLHRSGAYVQSNLPAWVPAFFEADEKSRGALLQTLRAYADANMNVQKAAAALLVHPNTVYSRMERIRELTGLDSQRYHDLTEPLLVIECRGT